LVTTLTELIAIAAAAKTGLNSTSKEGRELLPPPRPGGVVGEGPEAQFVRTRFVHRVVAHIRFLGGEVHASVFDAPHAA
jgi:hypothetical protein